MCGRRCGASRRSTSVCRRSASLMMTWVYSRSCGQVHRRQLEFEQLGRAADAAQRVLDFVRQVADQFLVDLALVEDALLAVELELLDVLAQLDDDLAVAGGADDAVHVQRFAPAAFEREVLAQVGVLVRQRLLAQLGQFVGVDEQRRQLQCARAPWPSSRAGARRPRWRSGCAPSAPTSSTADASRSRPASARRRACRALDGSSDVRDFALEGVDVLLGAADVVAHLRHALLVLGVISSRRPGVQARRC